MSADSTGSRETGNTHAQALAVAVVSRDDALVELLRQSCKTEGIECIQFKTIAKSARRYGDSDVAAILWDANTTEPDWKTLAERPEGTRLAVLGSPTALLDGGYTTTALVIPAGSAREEVARQVMGCARSYAAESRGEELRAELAGANERLDTSAGQIKALKEHIEFYELQRNQLSEVVRRTAYLGQLSKEINCLDTDKIIDICVTKIPKLVDAKFASVYVYNEETGELTLKQSNHPHRVTDRVPVDSAPLRLMTLALERKATLLIKDIDAFCQGQKRQIDRTYSGKYSTRSCIVVPLVNDNHVIAVLNLADKINGAPFDEVRDLPLVDHISQFVGIALRNCQLYQKVWHLAKTDSLTGFMNHNAFFDELHREIARVRRNKTDLSLVLLDVDNFKLFNDVHGHQVGDMILSQVSQLIRGNVRTVDVAARYGGDEFAVILSDTDIERASVVAERIRRAIAANQVTSDGQTFFVTISAGVAQYRMGQSLADIVNEADAALYRAKSKGRNAVAP